MNNNGTELSVNIAVVEKMAEIAAKEIEGVAGISNRALDLKSAVKTRKAFKGIKVESVNGAVKITAYICVKHGVVVKDVAAKVQENIKDKVQSMTGSAVTQVDVVIHDVDYSDENTEEE